MTVSSQDEIFLSPSVSSHFVSLSLSLSSDCHGLPAGSKDRFAVSARRSAATLVQPASQSRPGNPGPSPLRQRAARTTRHVDGRNGIRGSRPGMKRALIAQRGCGKGTQLIGTIVAALESLLPDLLQKHNAPCSDTIRLISPCLPFRGKSP